MSTFTPRTHLVLCLATLALAACSSKEGRIESGLKKGAEFARQSDWDKANVEVRNVLQIDPKNAQAYLIAAKVSEGQREPRRAYVQYVKATELKPDLLEAKVGMARLYLLSGDMAQAETTVDAVLAQDAKNADARTLRAALLARNGKSAEAMALVKDVLASSASSEASMLLAGLHANQSHWSEALAVIEAALKLDPKHPGLLQAAVEVAAANPQDAALADKADGFYKRATTEAPKNQDLWLAWARLHLARHLPDRAEAVLRESIKAQPEDGKRTLALLDFLQTVRGADVAEKQYLATIAEKPRDMAVRFGLAHLYLGTQRAAEGEKVLREIIDRSDDTPKTLQARTELAALELANGRQAEASTLLAAVLKVNPRDNAALVLRGRLNLLTGNPRDAVIDLRGALRDQPDSVDIVQLLAQAHRAAGEPQLAREVLAEAVKTRSQDPALRALLAADMADAKDYRAARTELDSGIKAAPDAMRLYELKAQTFVAEKDFAGAQKTLEQLKQQRPKDATAYVRLGQLLANQGKTEAALKEYDAGVAAVPADATPYVASIGLLTGLKRFDEANTRIQARQKADPANLSLHLQLSGEVALARNDFGAAEKAFRAVLAGSPQVSGAYISLAKALAGKGDAAAALTILADGEKEVPTDRALPMTRAEWLTRARRYDEAIALYDSLHKRYPDDDTVVNNLAYLLAEIKGDKASTERALALAGRFATSRNPGQLDSLGWIHYRLGQYDKAVPLLEKATALAPPSPLLQMHLGKALVKNGDAQRGKALIQRAIESKADLPRMDEARALLAQG